MKIFLKFYTYKKYYYTIILNYMVKVNKNHNFRNLVNILILIYIIQVKLF